MGYDSSAGVESGIIGSTDSSFVKGEKQPNTFKDVWAGCLFYVNLVAIIAVAGSFGKDAFSDNISENENEEDDISDSAYTGVIKSAVVAGVIALTTSGFMLIIMMAIAETLIKTALIMCVVFAVFYVIGSVYAGQIVFIIVSLVLLACTVCYAKLVWPRIPFATANLVTGITIIRANCGVSVAAYVFALFTFGWSMIWVVALTGVYDQQCKDTAEDETCEVNGGFMFLLLVSFYFTSEVIKNVVHVTVAGVSGTWWFSPDEASSCCSSAITSSLLRASTTSFGSICFGSLLVAVIQAMKEMARQARQNGENQILLCIVECILGCIQSIVEYFNKWAFIYVGLYGYGYCEAGKNVMTLFRNKGWDVVIADDLVGMTLFLVSVIVGGLTGGLAVAFELYSDWFKDFDDNALWIAFFIGFVIGLMVCFILMSTIGSSVNSVIVLFAEAPSEFQENHPELSNKMRAAYVAAHGLGG